MLNQNSRGVAMIITEHPKLEKNVIAGVSCIAVPFDIFVPVSGEPVILSYSFCVETAEKWAGIFSDDPMCKESIEWLEKEYKSIAEKLGYARFENENEHMYEYIMDSKSQLPKKENNISVRKISSNAVLSVVCEASGCDIEIADDGEDVIFAVLDGDRLLSYAGINDIVYDDGSVEISVETAPDHRRNGYGGACVCALCEHLLDKGRTVRYKCSAANHASSALAERCGFIKEGERFSLVFEKI